MAHDAVVEVEGLIVVDERATLNDDTTASPCGNGTLVVAKSAIRAHESGCARVEHNGVRGA